MNTTVTFELFHPFAFGAGDAVAVIDGGPGAVTVTLARNVTPFTVAEMFAVPVATAVSIPLALTLATLAEEELQLADAVRSCRLPSE